MANFKKWDNLKCLVNAYNFTGDIAPQWYVNCEDEVSSSLT
ncbi:hypothetical protein NPIL_221091, partial [Nephila pilipes]